MNLPKTLRQRLIISTAVTLAAITGAYLFPRGAEPDLPEGTVAEVSTEGAMAAATLMDGERDEESSALVQQKEGPASYSSALTAEELAAKPKYTTYIVVSGDTIEAIAAAHGLSTETLLWANGISSESILSIDQELIIPAMDGLVREVQEGDSLWQLAFDAGVDQDVVIEANPDLNPDALQPGDIVIIPGGKPPERGRMVASARGGTRSVSRSGQFEYWPTYGEVTSTYGNRVHPVFGTWSFHDGIDFGVSEGTRLVAVSSGTITMAGWHGGYGISVRIDHGNGVVSQYSHLSRAAVSVGEWVSAGEVIGYSGNTGTSTGAHLHFSVYVDGAPTDPWPWLP